MRLGIFFKNFLITVLVFFVALFTFALVMLVASRAYEANLSVVTTGRDMWNGALEVLRG